MQKYSVQSPLFPSKLPDIGTTIFSVMSQLALEHGAVNLGQGYPDFQVDSRLLALVGQAMLDGHNQYAPMSGIPELRATIAGRMSSRYATSYDIDTEITVTSGATEALMAAILACVQPGDEVIVLDPAYDSYVPAIRLAGGVVVAVPMTPPTTEDPHYRPDWNRVRNAISPRTRSIILNFPHNPTGTILYPDDLDALEQLLADNSIVVISDEVYEYIVFDGNPHLSMASRPFLAARSFVISSFGKTLHTTGWKIGHCCAPSAMTTELRKVHQFMTYSVSTPMQHGISAYLAGPNKVDELASFYQQRRDYLAAGLSKTAFKPLPSTGTFFLLADYSAISELSQDEFVRWLTIEHGVTAIPISAFQNMQAKDSDELKLIRLCFAKQNATLSLALERLAAIKWR